MMPTVEQVNGTTTDDRRHGGRWLVVAALILVLLAALSIVYRNTRPAAHPARLQNAMISEDGKVLAVAAERGPCDTLANARLETARREVRVTVEVQEHNGSCTDVLLFDYVRFDLARPLGTRTVLDSSRDQYLRVRTTTVAKIAQLTSRQ